jgi:hypothetical protein
LSRRQRNAQADRRRFRLGLRVITDGPFTFSRPGDDEAAEPIMVKETLASTRKPATRRLTSPMRRITAETLHTQAISAKKESKGGFLSCLTPSYSRSVPLSMETD